MTEKWMSVFYQPNPPFPGDYMVYSGSTRVAVMDSGGRLDDKANAMQCAAAPGLVFALERLLDGKQCRYAGDPDGECSPKDAPEACDVCFGSAALRKARGEEVSS